MRISLGDLNYYRESLNEIGAQSAAYVRESIEALGSGAGVTAMREAAIQAIQDSVGIHGEMAQALAGQLFDEVCMAEGLGVLDFQLIDNIIDFGMLEEKVRYFAKALVEGNGGKFLDDCSELANFYVRRCNWESMVRNCSKNGVRYARVPTGLETCDYCIMLASRGFVYWSKADAEHANHLHCDCIICPGSSSTTIDGYDPDALYDQWKESGFMPSKGGGSKTASKFVRADTQGKANAAMARIDDAQSISELRSLVESTKLDGMTDRQRQGLQWAVDRAKKRLS